MFLFTGCEAEDVDLALDIADAVLESALEEGQTSEQPKQEETVPESSQAPPVENETATETPVTEETPAKSEETQPEQSAEEVSLEKDGRYTSPEDVALYIHLYGELPSNYITKNEAKKLGWESNKGNLWDVTDQMSIGGDHFGNYEGALPDAKGRTWKECDVNYEGGYRGSERLLYSNDGLIFYTNDHYETFTQLY
ncbi:MAG: ribonuclease [Oscillospiraceae bacterium]|nr:ribonuclease [Oscillospiraceae bacterium]